MFPNFTGSSRKRNVNLSGRRTPSNVKPQIPGLSTQPQQHSSSLQIAQQQRARRETERQELEAAKKIQSAWRSRKVVFRERRIWRDEWDNKYGTEFANRKVRNLNEALDSVRLFLGFYDRTWDLRTGVKRVGPADPGSDLNRLAILVAALTVERGPHYMPVNLVERDDLYTLYRFMAILLHTITRLSTKNLQQTTLIQHILNYISQTPSVAILIIVRSLTPYTTTPMVAPTYFGVLSYITTTFNLNKHPELRENVLKCLIGPFSAAVPQDLPCPTPVGPTLYRALARYYLLTPHLLERLGEEGFQQLASIIHINDLSGAVLENIEEDLQARHQSTMRKGKLSNSPFNVKTVKDDRIILKEKRLWLTAYIIFFFRGRSQSGAFDGSNNNYLKCITDLVGGVAVEVGKRLDLEDEEMTGTGTLDDPYSISDRDAEDVEIEMENGSEQHPRRMLPLPPFIKDQLNTLVEQSSVSSLFSATTSFSQANSQSSDSTRGVEAQLLASYALTLLLVFERQKQAIRMWLYLASTADGVPAVRYLWEAAKRGKIYKEICDDVKAAVRSLKTKKREWPQENQTRAEIPRYGSPAHRQYHTYPTTPQNQPVDEPSGGDNSEWQVILLFLELYTFLLIVMDDEEFFSTGETVAGHKSKQFGEGSRTRESAPPLKDVHDLTIFLKNLAFAMYWYTSQIQGEVQPINSNTSTEQFNVAGVKGMGFEFVKTAVTGLLRMIYLRDSRRNFLPKDHWLMTAHFDMEGFIPAVVAEEEKRHSMEEEEEASEPDPQYTHHEFARRQLHGQQRSHMLAVVVPRLEILQHLPFFIPFHTRVQIFREFVSVDQRRRRGGETDPDAWREMIFHRTAHRRPGEDPREVLSKHHATIRRESVFEDALDEFYPLGDGLKEPIQITFVDQFGAQEAGIDGGGVTKEFLTSVTKEAFTSRYNLFVENKHHMLYPKPTSIEETRELMKDLGEFDSSEIESEVQRLLKQYEFLGRIVGKCMYEGILVDINFAGVFLLQWSVGKDGGGYRPGVNDLRDLDEELYQGLVALKNYTGDVETDFALNFTISSSLTLSNGKTKTITVDLTPNGSNIPVTNINRLEYIHFVSKYRLLGQPRQQINAFLQGLGSIISLSWLSMFNQKELQTLVGGGDSPIDVSDLRRHTHYGGVYTIGDDKLEHPVIQIFWKVLEEDLTDEERRAVLKFVTSVSRAPLLGFGMLKPRFSIRDAGDDQDRLPSTSTCVNLLKLPRYKDRETLRSKLMYAVNSGAGFDLS
ncbi:hypothetical protein DFH27DRAFT_158609 [Peziza echinospora]|nr:hypothetical protein DFH27DRAFT_158609 [Peziza echinospora]